MRNMIDPISLKTENVKSSLMTIGRSIKRQIEINNKDIISLSKSQIKNSGFSSSDDISDLTARIELLETSTQRLACKDGNAIKFNSVGFNGKDEADAWLDSHAPHGNFGFLID